MTVPEYMFMSKRLGFRLLEDHDLQNLMRLDMNREVRTFFPGGVSTQEQLREKIIRSHTSFLEKGFGEFSITDLKTNEFLGRAGFAELNNGEIEVGYVLLKEYWGKGGRIRSIECFIRLGWESTFGPAHSGVYTN